MVMINKVQQLEPPFRVSRESAQIHAISEKRDKETIHLHPSPCNLIAIIKRKFATVA